MKTAQIGLAAALLLSSSLAPLHAASMDDKASKDVLAAMDRTSTWGHPDEEAEFAGMKYYASGDYAKAMESFLEGARYADKLSQLSIGLMYLHGEGVEKDPVTAYAWIAIAAERKYPRFVNTREEIWKGLDDEQRQRATELKQQLLSEYGDAVAKVRMERALRDARAHMTGSLVGYGGSGVGSITVAQLAAANPTQGGRFSGAMPQCASSSIDGAPITGCGNLYVAWRWDAKQYFRVRDAAWTGTVTVGAAEKVDKSEH